MSYVSDLKKRLHQQIRKNSEKEPPKPPPRPVAAGGSPPKELNQLTLLVQDGCEHCEAVKEYMREEIESGAIKLCNIATQECRELADSLKIDDIPTAVITTSSGKQQCELQTEGDDFVIACPMDEQPKTQKKEEPEPEQQLTGLPRHPAITCMMPELKHQLGFQLQAKDAPSEALLALSAIAECADQDSGMPTPIGFGEVKRHITNVKDNPYRQFIKVCFKDPELANVTQQERMRVCAERYRAQKGEN